MRLFLHLCFLGFGYLLETRTSSSQTVPPWVSCFAEPPSGAWKGPRAVQTPIVRSADQVLQAYGVIEANEEGVKNCLNTVRLFVSTSKSTKFRQVYLEKGSPSVGTAISLEPLSWSPDGRWLLVAFGNWVYDSDAGGVSVLLYDKVTHKTIIPDFNVLLHAVLKKDCLMRISTPFNFDNSSRVHLQVSDDADEGDVVPITHCFKGREEWIFDPLRGTMRPK